MRKIFLAKGFKNAAACMDTNRREEGITDELLTQVVKTLLS